MEEGAVGWMGSFFILSQGDRAREQRGWLCFLNESPKTGLIHVIDVEFTILLGH